MFKEKTSGETKRLELRNDDIDEIWKQVDKVVNRFYAEDDKFEHNILICSGNCLTSLPDTLPQGLTYLYCSYNQLTSLSNNLPQGLIELDCSDNQLTSLPDTLPQGLIELDCSDNQLTSLSNNLPQGLIELDCSRNRLTSLSNTLPRGLTKLICSGNRLTSLSNNLPQGLTELWCSDNQLTSLPYSLIFCTTLVRLDIYNNPIEYQHEAVQRFITRIQERQHQSSSIYTDSQSVHNSTIQQSISSAISTLINLITPEQRETFNMSSVLSDPDLSPTAKESIIEYCSDKTTHSILLVTFSEVFRDVWLLITSHSTSSTSLKRILSQEITDSLCKCFTGRLSRLISSLSGGFFPEHPEFEIKISSSEQIANIISLSRDKLQSTNSYTLESHRQLVRKELEERSYSTSVIEEWLSYLDS